MMFVNFTLVVDGKEEKSASMQIFRLAFETFPRAQMR